MIIANRTLKVPTWLRAMICAVAICVFPLGLVYAQDFEAVEQRLGGAVEAGDLSLEQANIMMEALKRSASSGHSKARDIEARKRRYMEFTEQIKDAVESGELSKEEAEKKLIGLRKKMFSDKKDISSDKPDAHDIEARKRRYTEFAAKIKEAVESGELSKEDAEKRLSGLRKKRVSDKKDRGRPKRKF